MGGTTRFHTAGGECECTGRGEKNCDVMSQTFMLPICSGISLRYLPADGMIATAEKGTSARPAGSLGKCYISFRE